MNPAETAIAIYLVTVNVVAAVMSAADKHRARRHRRRISERALLSVAFFGGAAGEYITMVLIRHKTKHKKFMVLLPLFIILHVAIIVAYIYYKFEGGIL